MNWYLAVKTVHIISATVLLGTGIGIAFFMFRSRFSDNIHERLYAASNTVMADYLFTLPAVLIQPLSGAWLVWKGGYNWADNWLAWTYVLYILAGMCWLPVVWIQIRLKTLVSEAIHSDSELPDSYHRLFNYWILLGIPAFTSLLIVFYLMVYKPA